ncbi:hypothetical protein [Hymenobacter tenuis]
MKKLSNGTKYTLAAFAFFTVLGLYFTYRDYTQHDDLSNIWWPLITALIFVIVYIGGRMTDNKATMIGLLLLATAAASCSRASQVSSWEHQAAKASDVVSDSVLVYRDVEGYDCTVAVR